MSAVYDEDYEILQYEDGSIEVSTPSSMEYPNTHYTNDDDFRATRSDFEILQMEEEDEMKEFPGLSNLGFGSSYGGFQMGNLNMGLQSMQAPFQYGQYAQSGLYPLSVAEGFGSFNSPSSSFFSSSKKRMPTLNLQGAPLMAPAVEIKPVTSYIVKEQPIKAPRTVIQPIIHQRIVEQPITKTRVITQPVIRRLITQPILQPHLIQTTQVRQKIIDQPITVPKVTKQDIIKQVLIEQPETKKTLTRPTIVETRRPKVTTVFMGKNAPRQLSKLEAQMAAHPELKFSNLQNLNEEQNLNLNWM
jgi:hypothetical protein